MGKVRIDKWLWSVRIFKSRTKATDACKSGRVTIDDKTVKPSTEVLEDHHVGVRKNGFNLEFKVIKLINKRVSAVLAVECYENLTSEEELNKFNDWFVGKARAEIRTKGAGRPTKKDRREISGYKEQYLWDHFDEEEDG